MRTHGLSRRGSSRAETGAVAVEFALIFPVLVMLLAGITTAGLSYTHALGLTNAVREGARLGATADASSSTTWASDVINRVRATQFDDSTQLANTTTAVCVDLLKLTVAGGAWSPSLKAGTSTCSTTGKTPALSASSAPAAPATTNLAAGTCVIRVWAARNFEISVIIAPVLHGTVLKQSVARYERGSC
jgi:Flp pilus assembly protein TadG